MFDAHYTHVPWGRRRFAPWVTAAVVLALGMLLCRAPAPAAAQDEADGDAPPLGMSIGITLPISRSTVGRVERFIQRGLQRAKVANKRPVLIFRFEVPQDEGDFAGTEFGVALDLARILVRFGKELNVARTVAYVPESVSGHAVLVAMACDEIMMHADAQLGPVDATPDAIRKTERSGYAEIANSHPTITAPVALWLLDPSLKVLKVETLIGREYVFQKDLEKLRKNRTVKEEQELGGLVAQPGQFTGEEARLLGFVSHLPATADDLAEELGVSRNALHDDPSLVGDRRAVRIDLKGPISGEMVRQAQNLIQKSVRDNEVNFVCLWIDSGGGSLDDSVELAKTLGNLPPNKVHTVAYVPSKARADAALVALACDEVLMHPRAELGGAGEKVLSDEKIGYLRGKMIPDEKGPWKARSRSWSLIIAMIDPNLEVFRCERLGEVRYFSEEEIKELEEKWEIGMPVTGPGEPLKVDGEQAVEYGLANDTVESFTEFKEYYYGLDDLAVLEPGWADFLIEALKSPGVSAVLLTIAFVALYIELSMPGIGAGGFVATVCFLLYFWAHYLGGTATTLEITLFLAGVSCLLLEVFVLPGFGIFGLGGGCLVLISLILASQTFVLPRNEYQLGQLQRSLLMIAGAGVGIVASAVMLRRWLPSAPILNRLFLQPPAGEEAESISHREALVDLNDFIGNRGTTTTQLTPSGKARFGDMLVDVITDGDVVGRGTEIEVVEVHGNRVIVKVVDG